MSAGRSRETTCAEVMASLSAYVDGEVGAEEFHLVAIHITECSPCEEEERAHRIIKALVVRAVGGVAAPVELRTRILARLTVDLPDTREGEQ